MTSEQHITPDPDTPVELPYTPHCSPPETIVLTTPVEKNVRFSDGTPEYSSTHGPSAGPSTSGQGPSRAPSSLRIPEFPANHVWEKAVGLVKPVYAPFGTYQELRAAVDECDHPNVETFHGIFDFWVKHFHNGDKAGRQRETSLSWCDLYANYIFMACEFFMPRACFDGPDANVPVLFSTKLPRDDVIAWVLSFLTGKLFARKMITSRMQTLKKAIMEKDEDLWTMMEKTNMPSPGKKGSAKCRGRKPSVDNHRDNMFHPFLAYLLRLDETIDTPSKAFTHPALDVSHVEPPRGFLEAWIALRDAISEQAEINKAARNAVKCVTSPAVSAPPTTRKSRVKRKCVEPLSPSKKRIVLKLPKAESVAVPQGIITAPIDYALTSSQYDYDTDDVYDDDNDIDQVSSYGSRAHSPSFYKLSTPNRPSIPAVIQPLLSATPNASECRTKFSDEYWQSSNSALSIESILDRPRSFSDRLENTDSDVAKHPQREDEADAVNALLDLNKHYRVHMETACTFV